MRRNEGRLFPEASGFFPVTDFGHIVFPVRFKHGTGFVVVAVLTGGENHPVLGVGLFKVTAAGPVAAFAADVG